MSVNENAANNQGSFNDSELQDIMTEIENLEKEFVEGGGESAEALGAVEKKEEKVEPTMVASSEVETTNIDEKITHEDTSIAEEEEILIAETKIESIEEQPVMIESEPSIVEKKITKERSADPVISHSKIHQLVPEGEETAMNFTVCGKIKLKLNFVVKGKLVAVSVDEENRFIIELAGGAKFTVPLEPSANKKAA